MDQNLMNGGLEFEIHYSLQTILNLREIFTPNVNAMIFQEKGKVAMKACPNSTILKYFSSRGIHIDASSGYECRRAMAAGIPASNISLSTQELPEDFAELVKMGVKLNAW